MPILTILGYVFLIPGALLALYFVGVASSMSSPYAGDAKPPDLGKTYSLLALAVVLIAVGVALIKIDA